MIVQNQITKTCSVVEKNAYEKGPKITFLLGEHQIRPFLNEYDFSLSAAPRFSYGGYKKGNRHGLLSTSCQPQEVKAGGALGGCFQNKAR